MTIKSRIKRRIQNNPLLYALVRVVNNRHDERFIKTINNYDVDPEIIMIKPGTKWGVDYKPLCRITAGNGDDGFFACLRWALDGLYFCDRMGFIPIIGFPDDSLYKDEIVFKQDVNAFEYYFEKCSSMSIKESNQFPNVIYHKRNMLLAENLNGGISYKVTREYIFEMGKIVNRYLRFNEKTQKELDDYIDKKKIDRGVLGVHIRGTDYRKNYCGHPKYIKPEEFIPYVDDALDGGSFSHIYLATDDQEILDLFISHYSNVIYADSSTRGRGTTGVHVETSGGRTPYYKGLDVLKDMVALSKCGGLISGISQVPIMARIFASGNGNQYQIDNMINHGINERGRRFHV